MSSPSSLIHSTQPVFSRIRRSGMVQDFLACFRSIHLAIILLSLLAIGTIIGVVLPQVGMVEVTDIQKAYGVNYKFLNTLGFFNVYSSFWFITLQVLFFFNLLIGSFKWLKPATLAAIQKYTLSPALVGQKPEVHALPFIVSGTLEQIEPLVSKALQKFRYGIFRDAAGNVYASKGNISRLGPCIAHVGILLCLIGGVYSSFTGFKAVRMATPGQTFTIPEANTFKTNVPQAYWLGSVPNWKIHVSDFQIEFYKDHPETAKQYTSFLQILSPNGKVIKSQAISVNHPLIYDNISIYQASFAPTGRFLLNINNRPVVMEINSNFNQRQVAVTRLADGTTLLMFPFFAGQDPGVANNFAMFMVQRRGEPMVRGRMPANIRVLQGGSGDLKGYHIQYFKPEMSTGLQIKRAPEVPLMYLSYLIIMIGAILCFFSQRQVWVTLQEISPQRYAVLLYPKTNKARLSFHRELFKIHHALFESLSALRAMSPPPPPSTSLAQGA